MTPFKENLNRELGEKPRFSKDLKERILQKAQEPLKKRGSWQYPMAIVTTLSIFLLFVLVGPWTKTESQLQPSTSAPFEEIVGQQEIEKFAVTESFERWSFMAQETAWSILQENFHEEKHRKILQDLLEQAILTEEVTSFRSNYDDVYVKFGNEQVLQLKMKSFETWIGFVDMESSLFYMVEGDAAKKMIVLFENETYSKLGLFSLIIITTRALIEYIMRKKLGIIKASRYVNKAHKITSIIWLVIMFIVCYLLIVKGWILYKPVIALMILGGILVNLVISYTFGRERKEQLISIVDLLVAAVFLFVLMVVI